jgi:Flp pilus assembly pilin Flp
VPDLDAFLGPREPHDPLPPRRTPGEILAAGLQATGRWRCEDRIKGTLDAFIEAAGDDWMPRSDVGRRSMYASARPIVDEIGEDQAPPFVRWAVGVMRRKGLDVKDLRSLAFLLPTWRKDQGGPEWMRTACPDCHTYHPDDEMCREEAGQGLAEYALVILLVALAVIVMMVVFGQTVGNMFSTIVGSF